MGKQYNYSMKVKLNKNEQKTRAFPVASRSGETVFRHRTATKKSYTNILRAMGYRYLKDYVVEADPKEHALWYHFTTDVKEVDMSYFAMMNDIED